VKLSDYLGFGLFLAIGLWWTIFPESVIRFYTRFHRGLVAMPRPWESGWLGIAWIIVVCRYGDGIQREINCAAVRKMKKEPNQPLEPTLTIRPFSFMIATLETPSSLWVSVAHL